MSGRCFHSSDLIYESKGSLHQITYARLLILFNGEEKIALNAFFQRIKLRNQKSESGKDKAAKIEQVLAYLEIVHAQMRKYSKKRRLICIESGAGNCYLSLLVYYFYTAIDKRPITIHCLDTNSRLMEKARQCALALGFDRIHFHSCDIAEFTLSHQVDMVYSLHACDSATDKTLYLGLRQEATCILSVACCQHRIKQQLRSHPYKGISKHHIFKDKIVYMVDDALRALLLEMQGYKVDILEFASSRYTDKNIMIRARKSSGHNIEELKNEYARIRNAFHVMPLLEQYLEGEA
jgi:hypothetical protein